MYYMNVLIAYICGAFFIVGILDRNLELAAVISKLLYNCYIFLQGTLLELLKMTLSCQNKDV